MAKIDAIKDDIEILKNEISGSYKTIDGEKLEAEVKRLRQAMDAKDFWANNQKAADISKQYAKLESRVQPWLDLRKRIDDLSQLVELSDDSMADDLERDYILINTDYEELKGELKLAGIYDNYDAIVSIYSGAGGTDAQDWAEMLERMYLRWAEKK
jgi:peptide chain release factor 2